MRLFKVVEDECVDHMVVALDAEEARQLVIKSKEGDLDTETKFEAEEIPPDQPVKVEFEPDVVITHTAREWGAIYEGYRHVLSCSEY